MRRNILSLVRKMNVYEIENELYENAKANVVEEG
jgi:hypothetical protein